MATRQSIATDKAVKLAARGATYLAAATKAGVSISTVVRACASAGIRSQHKAGGDRRPKAAVRDTATNPSHT